AVGVKRGCGVTDGFNPNKRSIRPICRLHLLKSPFETHARKGLTTPPAAQGLRLEDGKVEMIRLDAWRCDGLSNPFQAIQCIDGIQLLHARRLEIAATQRRQTLRRQFGVVAGVAEQLAIKRAARANHVVDFTIEWRARYTIAESTAEEI